MKLEFDGNDIQCHSRELGNFAAVALAEYDAEEMDSLPVIGCNGTLIANTTTHPEQGAATWIVTLGCRPAIAFTLAWAMAGIREYERRESAEIARAIREDDHGMH